MPSSVQTLDPSLASRFIGPHVEHRNLHVQIRPTIAQVLSHQHRRLLANQECSTISVTPNIVWTDTQIRTLQPFDPVHVEPLV